MAIVSDIDLSFETHPYTNDLLISEDEQSIKDTLYNNLFVSHDDRPYYKGYIESIEELLHQPVDFVTKRLIKNTIAEATKKDDRIKTIEQIKIEYNDVTNIYEVGIKLSLNLKPANKDVNIGLILRR